MIRIFATPVCSSERTVVNATRPSPKSTADSGIANRLQKLEVERHSFGGTPAAATGATFVVANKA
jgi:hypothetical protein